MLFDQNQNKTINLNTSLYFTSSIQSIKSTSTNNKIHTKAIKTTIDSQLPNQQSYFIDFILKLITKQYNTHGYIQSCQQGKQNHSLFFYNIGGPFRFCERLQRHHKSNQTCIIIDTLTLKYQIKCKDPDCQNFKPSWKQIPDLNK